MTIINNFGKNLKKLRLSHDLTQSELGKYVQITKQVISAYENEKCLPDLYTIIKFSNFFNCSIDSLVFSNSEVNGNNLNTVEELTTINILLKSKLNKIKNANEELIKITTDINSDIISLNKIINKEINKTK